MEEESEYMVVGGRIYRQTPELVAWARKILDKELEEDHGDEYKDRDLNTGLYEG